MDMRTPFVGALLGLGVAALGWTSSSCAPAGFLDQSQIESVRIIASAADKPYAKPGDTVTLSVLAFDGRASKPEPMTLYWLPFVCENPTGDAYYACFEQLAGVGGGGGDAGPPDGGGGGLALKPGVDLTPFLPTGPTYTFQMPADAITSHVAVAGSPVPYGLAYVFNAACAGHLELVPFDDGNPQQPPIACFDSSHNELGPDDWVFGFTRVYSYDGITNANPVISAIDENGQSVPVGGFSNVDNGTFDVARCSSDCPKVVIGPVVPPSSQETQMQIGSGAAQREEIWVDFYSTLGTFGSDARLLYDPSIGSIGKPSVTDDTFDVPSAPGDGLIWMVVHDNRGGASWATVPVHVE
jgi:hypothetical protein